MTIHQKATELHIEATKLRNLAWETDKQAAWVQSLAADLATDLKPPVPVALVTGPPWPTGHTRDGAAPATLNTADPARPAVQVTLRPRTAGNASSDGHDIHVQLGRRIPAYTWEIELNVDSAMLRALTFKVAGMVSFEGDWTKWPGGNTSAASLGTTNAMERLVGQNAATGRPWTSARWGCYATFPTPVAKIPSGETGTEADVGGHTAWVTNKGHTCHWLIPTQIDAGRWVHHRRAVDYAAGTLRHWIDGALKFELTGLPWPKGGANRVYMSCMIGGSGPEFLPPTPDRTGMLAYRGYRLTEGAQS